MTNPTSNIPDTQSLIREFDEDLHQIIILVINTIAHLPNYNDIQSVQTKQKICTLSQCNALISSIQFWLGCELVEQKANQRKGNNSEQRNFIKSLLIF
ncbi:unnamed protein product [Paramecium octaurelia]|uniref:Uncharacterized protein n=1 Tax=Paramecium octaurelia TaxID=43137 RepID=A0A8S1SZ58_PAROT|nr:unnamed protein product [Paramecium octaurelia]